jgi:alkylation response protein AidB-like acyl-CoA dehydrogenase
VLNGVKQFISGAGASDLYLTMARTGGQGAGGVSALLVPKDAPGLSFGANEKKMGWNAQPTRQVVFEDCRVPATALLGEEGQGFRFAMQGLDGGRLNIGACSLGGAQRALDIALAYVQERSAFGQASAGSRRRSSAWPTCRPSWKPPAPFCGAPCAKLDAKAPDATAFCAMAKRFATDTGHRVADEALQLSAATATWPITGWRRSCGTCGSTASWKAPTRSCG